MILNFLIGPDDSISIVAANIAAIRETGNDLVIYLTSGAQIRVPNDPNRGAVTLWRLYWEGQQ